ncbi:MAG: DUF4838 domain-containing protein, partial [Candidatus Omnitrophica bacterium]|nr:DUF4838 domain-containing protein [Candidatus Omnitrophota bacterium]
CQCPGCKALDAGDFDPTLNCISVTDRYIHFLNQIVQKVTEKFPEVKFGFLVYVQYSRPPLRERLHSNLIPVITPITFCRAHSVENESCESRKKLREIVEKWSKISGSGLGLYEYGFNLAEVSVPFPMITKWSQDLKFFFSHNVRYWIPETMANFDTALPGLYLGIKLAWNPEENPEKILEELYDKFYGPAAEYMKGYWQTMDDAWTKTTSHTGCVFGYQQRFTQETMKKARDAINEALRNCPENTLYYQRVKMVDESFNQFELFMKMLRNFHSCNFSNIESDAETWVRKQTELGNKYEKNYAFCKSDRNWAVRYFTIFLYPAYKDAARIHQNYDILTAITEWKYRVDKENSGEKQGWFKRNFDDASWEIINPSEKTWADIGLWDYYGAVWYRKIVKIPNIPEGKKIYLWIGLGDDTFKVYVNGQHISYRTHDGKQLENFSGYCKPVSFDITEAVEKGKENQITIIGIRSTINELGTGGIMSPVLIYRDK